MSRIKNVQDMVSAIGVIDEMGVERYNYRTQRNTFEVIGVTFEVDAFFDHSGYPEFNRVFAERRYEMAKTKVLFELNETIKLLKSDRSTREAYIIGVDYHPENVPCNVVHHFILRDEYLYLIVYLRSSDAIMKLIYDLYTNTRLLVEVALAIGVDPGMVIFNVGSFHYYEDDIERKPEMSVKDWRNFVTVPIL